MSPLLPALLLASTAVAGTSDYTGLPVAQVRVSGAAGPDESLDPLLRMRQGEAFDPRLVRADLATLFRVGEFAAVEADAEPWFTYDLEGNPIEAVLLTYTVYPAPRAVRVRVQGNRALSTREILDAARLPTGQPFYEELDGPVVAARLHAWLGEVGYPSATVEIDPVDLGEGRVEVWIRLHEGPPRLVQSLSFEVTGDLDIPDRTLRRWAQRAGVHAGKPLGDGALASAEYDLREQLARLPTALRPRSGYTEARVRVQATEREDGVDVTCFVEPGPKLEIQVSGLGLLRTRSRVVDALELNERVRLTRGFVEDAPLRMVDALQRRGFLQATADVTLEEEEEGHRVLKVDVERGARHTLTHIDFEGAMAVDPARLTAVMQQASPDVLRRNRVTEAEIERGLAAAEAMYAANGYQEASLVFEGQSIGVRKLPIGLVHPWDGLRWLTGIRLVGLEVGVVEGPLTTLASAEVRGAAQGVDIDDVREAVDSLQGRPFSPPALDRLAHRTVAAHKEQGYLEADARVAHTSRDEGTVEAAIVITPGDRVLLRSVTTRGTRRTRPEFVRREVDLDLGAPVTSGDLEEVRRRLYDLGIFSSVSTELLGDDRARDLLVAVDERNQWGFEAGAGASTDDGVRTFGRVTRRNLWGRAHRIEAYGQVGAVWNGDEITDWVPDFLNPEWRAAISYVAPRFFMRNQELVVDLLLREEIQESSWRLARTGIGLSLDTQLGKRTTIITESRIEQRRLDEIDVGALLPGEPWSALIDPANVLLPTDWRVQGGSTAIVLHDLRDDPLQPTRGLLLSVLGQGVPPLPFSDLPEEATVSFIKGEARVSAYVPAGPFVVRMSTEGGRAFVIGDGVVPLEDRYRLGGTGSVRGFRRDGVGPRNEVSQPDIQWPDAVAPVVDQVLARSPTRWVPTGGDAHAMGTLEIMVPLPALGLDRWDGYAAALFTDVGNAWLLGNARASSDANAITALYDPVLRYSIGAGLRIGTPIGPLQVDVATNIDALMASGVRKDLLDSWEEPAVRAHLSLGTLF